MLKSEMLMHVRCMHSRTLNGLWGSSIYERFILGRVWQHEVRQKMGGVHQRAA